MVELTSGTLSVAVLVCSIVCLLLYFLGITWPGVYVSIYLFTSVASCAAEIYWWATSRTSNTDDDDDDDDDNKVKGGGHVWGGSPHSNDRLKKLAKQTPDVNPRRRGDFPVYDHGDQATDQDAGPSAESDTGQDAGPSAESDAGSSFE